MASTCNISPINTKNLIVSSSHRVQNLRILLPKPSLIPWLQLFPSFRFNSLSYLPTRPQPSKSPIRAALDGNYSSEGIISSNEQRETIKVPPGCDFNHWLILMHFPKDPAPTRAQMIDTYLDTLATVLGSMEEAKKNMYAFSTTTYTGFQCTVSEETSEKFKVLDGVLWVLPDAYLNVKNKDYGGDKYVNGEIIPSTYQPKPRGQSKYENRRYERQKTGPPLAERPKQEATQSESASRYVNGEIIPSTCQPKPRGQSKYENRRYERRKTGPPLAGRPKQEATQSESASRYVNGEIIPSTYQSAST